MEKVTASTEKPDRIEEERKAAIARLKECQENGDTEDAHWAADGVLIGLLQSLGYDDVVAEWRKVDKWYA